MTAEVELHVTNAQWRRIFLSGLQLGVGGIVSALGGCGDQRLPSALRLGSIKFLMQANPAVISCRAKVMLWKLGHSASSWAHVTIRELSRRRLHRRTASWNPSSSWKHRVIHPLCSPAPEPARDVTNDSTIPPFCFVAVLFWRVRRLRCGYRIRTWTATGVVAEAEPYPASHRERRSEYGASTAGFASHR